MSDFGPEGASTHPLGWAFLGIGALLWISPIAILLGHPLLSSSLGSDALSLSLLVAVAAGFGLLLEGLLVPLERSLLRLTKIRRYEPPGDSWRDASIVRWQHSGADDEFKRNEALTSFARAYMFHALCGTVLWVPVAFRTDGPGAALVTLLIGAAVVSLLAYIWYRRTRLIFTLVNTAAKWAAGPPKPSDARPAA